MLDFNASPTPAHSLLTHTQGGAFLNDLKVHVNARTDLSAITKPRYLGAIDKVEEVLNRPLSTIRAELGLVETRFPLNGFDPNHWPTNAAYQLFRRRFQAPLREFLGVHAALARLRAMDDGWTQLLAAVTPLTEGKIGQNAPWHPMKLEALKTFALVARSYKVQPRDLTHDVARKIDADFTGNKRESNYRSLQGLDDLRQFPDILPLLPVHPIRLTARDRQPLLSALNPLWEAQFLPWIDAVTNKNWDPVSGDFADKHVKHARVLRSAFRTMLRIALDQELIAADTTDLKPLLMDNDALCSIASEMFERRLRKKKDGRLVPRTSRKYLKAINQVREHLRMDTSLMKQVIANNAVSRQGQRDDKRMTQKNRQFCETLVEKLHLRRRFLTSFEVLRAAAQDILDAAVSENRKLTGQERSRVRLLGASACFAALEIGGAPIRVENAMALTCVGEDAQIRIPEKGKKPIKVLIPAELTKNKSEIAFPIRSNGYGYYDTIRWYLTEVRPLFSNSASSSYLFPAVKTVGAQLNANYFGSAFASQMRIIVDLPMTPHQMRHGQTSLLLNKYPNEIEVIAKRIDDKPETLRQFYGWLNALKLVERGQDLLVGLMHD